MNIFQEKLKNVKQSHSILLVNIDIMTKQSLISISCFFLQEFIDEFLCRVKTL